MYISTEEYADAASVSDATAFRRLKGLPYRIPTRGRGRKHFPLAAAVMTLKGKEVDSGAVDALTEAARDLFGHDLYIEPEALPMAHSFAEWLPSETMRARLRAAQNFFTVAVANSRLCTPAIVRNLSPLRELFALCPPVLVWVLTGGEAPDIDYIAPAFAVSSNEAALDQYHTPMTMQEAA
ncbi:hypothetical protein SAMN05421853_11093 [Roseivivax halotolerans]|uniref:Uncharacterized protein n=1 Tax=Roseivivax halotolerans TaxID=93684 RepID=A0A1I5ZK49_9RHOB|nr:hypothetical protein [Roseivivax halotolerans]SFQ56497.1 hypothetical protein SAMN05421853_11093 [Roseivivax halotolerans]